MEKIQKNIGFDYKREKREITEEDVVYGAKKISGLGDKVGGIVTALYAWPDPVNGIYPRVMYGFNHAIDMISEVCKKYLPIGTVQRGTRDWMNCASNAPNNEIEKQVNYGIEKGLFSKGLIDWWKEKGYINPENGKFEISDAFTAIGSGTTETGNSLRAPIVFIENHSVIPRSMLPDDKSMNWDQYHNPKRITQAMWDLSKECRKRLKINYQRKVGREFASFLENLRWEIFDSYVDPVDGDFIKRLAPDYNLLGYGYRLIINENITESKKKMERQRLEFKYQQWLMRGWSESKDGSGYLNHDEDFVDREMGKSPERWKLIRGVNFLKRFGLIKLFEKGNRFGNWLSGLK